MSQEKDPVEFFLDQARKVGASCATVEDGHMLIFKRDFLNSILEKHPNKEEIVIFLKRPNYNN